MGKRGPKPTSAAILEARGSWRAASRVDPPQLESKIPDMPRWLSSKARDHWRRIIPSLAALRVISDLDANLIARYCDAWARWVDLSDDLTRKGTTQIIAGKNGLAYSVQRPEVSMQDKLTAQLLQMEKELGLTPSARSRIEVVPEVVIPSEEQEKQEEKLRILGLGNSA